MNTCWLKKIIQLGWVLIMGLSMSACSKSWQEEVQLHDGSKIIVSRSIRLGGRHELFQELPIKEQQLTWSMPNTNQTITWEDHYSEELGMANFLPMLVDVHQGVAYVVANPMGCLAYNKWGSPNPPYVVFKYQDKEWKRIPLQELPTEIKTPNIIFSDPGGEVKRIGKNFITAEMIQKIVNSTFQPEYRSILREPVNKGSGGTSCEELIFYKGSWIMPNDPVARKMLDQRSNNR